jgi:hypothetical protein
MHLCAFTFSLQHSKRRSDLCMKVEGHTQANRRYEYIVNIGDDRLLMKGRPSRSFLAIMASTYRTTCLHNPIPFGALTPQRSTVYSSFILKDDWHDARSFSPGHGGAIVDGAYVDQRRAPQPTQPRRPSTQSRYHSSVVWQGRNQRRSKYDSISCSYRLPDWIYCH